MRAQVTFSPVPLSPKVTVTVIDRGEHWELLAEEHTVDLDDAEYILLAQAVDRFVRISRMRAESKARERAMQ